MSKPIARPPSRVARAKVERLMWRAGFGAVPGDVDRLARAGMTASALRFPYVSRYATRRSWLVSGRTVRRRPFALRIRRQALEFRIAAL